MRDLVKKGLLQPLDRKAKDDSVSIGNSKAYCTYHQRRDHSTNFCKVLEAMILDLIAKGYMKLIIMLQIQR